MSENQNNKPANDKKKDEPSVKEEKKDVKPKEEELVSIYLCLINSSPILE